MKTIFSIPSRIFIIFQLIFTGFFFMLFTTAYGNISPSSALSVSRTISVSPDVPGPAVHKNFNLSVYLNGIEPRRVALLTESTWLGLLSDDWNNSNNWDGGIPTANTNVHIPYTGLDNYPVISTGTAMSNNINIYNGASLTVNNATIQIAGIIDNAGLFDLRNGTLELNGITGSQYISGSMFIDHTIKNIIASNTSGVKIIGLNDSLRLTGNLTFGKSNVNITTNNMLILVSNASGTASVGDMTNKGTVSGNSITGFVIVERFIPGLPDHAKAWQFLSVPTKGSSSVKSTWQEGNTPRSNELNPGYGTIITSNIPGAVGLGFDIYTTGGASMKTFNSSTDEWVGISSTEIPISNSKGYMLFVRGDRSVTAFNQPATSTVLRTTGLLYTPGANAAPLINVKAGTFESIGNPYASAINFSKIRAGGVQDLFYVWDPKLTSSEYSSYGLGAYQTIIGPGPQYTVIPGGGSYANGNTNIESGQAFFVHAPEADGTIQFSENCKTTGSNLVTRPSMPAVRQLRNNLYAVSGNNATLLDGVLVQFDHSFSNSVDIMDARKIKNTSESISIFSNDKKLSAERRAEIRRGDTILLNLEQLRVQEYRFEFIASNFNRAGLTAFLEDRFLNTVTTVDMSDTTRISFNVINDPGSYASNRFRLILSRMGLKPFTVNEKSAMHHIDQPVSINRKYANEVDKKNAAPVINIFPNPVTGKFITMEFMNHPTGNFTFNLLSNNGKQIQVYDKKINYKQNNIVLLLPPKMNTGVYYLKISGPDNFNFIKPVFVSSN